MRVRMPLFFAGCFAFFAACSSDNKPPHGVIGRTDMEGILWDMIQAEQYATLYIPRDSTKGSFKDEELKMYQKVFDLHHISRDEFKKSYDWYIKHPDLASNMFDSIAARGQRLRNESYSLPAYGPLKQAPPSPPPSLQILPPGGGHNLPRPFLNRDSIFRSHRDSAARVHFRDSAWKAHRLDSAVRAHHTPPAATSKGLHSGHKDSAAKEQ